MEGINPSNIRYLKAIKKLMENPALNGIWPSEITQHKTACINALTNAIDTCTVVLSQGGTKTVINDAMAGRKLDLFSSVELQKKAQSSNSLSS